MNNKDNEMPRMYAEGGVVPWEGYDPIASANAPANQPLGGAVPLDTGVSTEEPMYTQPSNDITPPVAPEPTAQPALDFGSIYQDTLGRDADEEGQAFYQGLYDNGYTEAQIRENIGQSERGLQYTKTNNSILDAQTQAQAIVDDPAGVLQSSTNTVNSVQNQLNILIDQLEDNPDLQGHVDSLIVQLSAAEKTQRQAYQQQQVASSLGNQGLMSKAVNNPGSLIEKTQVASADTESGLIDPSLGQIAPSKGIQSTDAEASLASTTNATTTAAGATLADTALADTVKAGATTSGAALADTTNTGTTLAKATEANTETAGATTSEATLAELTTAGATLGTTTDAAATMAGVTAAGVNSADTALVGEVSTYIAPEGQGASTVEAALAAAKAEGIIDGTSASTADPTDKATVQGQLVSLMADFDNKATPIWASGAMRRAMSAMQARGMGASSIAGSAVVQSAMESAMAIAAPDAQTNAQFQMQNLNNQQATTIFKTQQRLGALFTDQAATNAALQFNATSQNQTDQFFSGLKARASEFNSSQVNAINQFNAGQTNEMGRFNSAEANVTARANAAEANATARSNAAAATAAARANADANNALSISNAAAQTASDAENARSANLLAQFNAGKITAADLAKSAAITASDRANAAETNLTNRYNAGEINRIDLDNAKAKTATDLANSSEANLNSRYNAGAITAADLAAAAAITGSDAANAVAENLQNRANADELTVTARANAAATTASDRANATAADAVSALNVAEANAASLANSAALTAAERANADADNAVEKYNSELFNADKKYNATNSLVIGQANAVWRQSTTTAETAAQNLANINYTKNVNAITGATLDTIWQRERDLMDFAFNGSENAADRATEIVLSKISADSSTDAIELRNKLQGQNNLGSFLGSVVTGIAGI